MDVIKIKPLCKDFLMPERKTSQAIAYDVYLQQDWEIKPGRQLVPLSFAIELPKPNQEAKIEPRSGYSAKGMEGYTERIAIENECGGVMSIGWAGYGRFNADVLVSKIDADYRGEVHAIIKSDVARPFIIRGGTRIAQMTIYEVPETKLEIATELSNTDRGAGGFGHTK